MELGEAYRVESRARGGALRCAVGTPGKKGLGEGHLWE